MHFLNFFLIPAVVSGAAIGRRSDTRSRAAYFLDNNPNGASIVSLKISTSDGTLSDPRRISTGGTGLLGLTAGTNGSLPAVGGADTLFSQDAVVVSGDYLFTVNAGSKTISMFMIDKNDPSNPKLLNTAPTLGDFPASVAYSPKIKTACVLNGGAVAGVTCFSVTHNGLSPLDGLRPIALNQTTPPVGPAGTASDLIFNPSQTALIATIKGSPTTPGTILAYPITDRGSVSTTPVVSRRPGLLLDFGLSFLGSDNRAVIADPAIGANIISISPFLAANVATPVPVPGQAAVCWTFYSQRFNSIFLMDAGKSNVTIVDPNSGSITGVAAQDPAGQGSLDAAMDREFLYVLKKSPSIGVSDVMGLTHGKAPKPVQSLDLSALGSRVGFQGIAVYPS